MANRTYTVGGRTFTVSDKERQAAIQEIATKGYRDYSKVVNEVNSLTNNQRAALEAALSNNVSVRQRDARNRPEDTAIAKYIEAIKEITREDGTVPYGPDSYRFNVYSDGVPDVTAKKAYDSLSYKDQLLLELDKKGKPVTPDFGDPNEDTSVYDRYQQALRDVEQAEVDAANSRVVNAVETAYKKHRGDYTYDFSNDVSAIQESYKGSDLTQTEIKKLYKDLQSKYDLDDDAYRMWAIPQTNTAAKFANRKSDNKSPASLPGANDSQPVAAPVSEDGKDADKSNSNSGQTLEQYIVEMTTPKDSEKAEKVKALAESEANLVGGIVSRWGKQYSKLTGRDDGEQKAKSQFATDAVNVYLSAMKGAASAVGDVANAAAHVTREANALYRKWIRGDDSEIKEGEFAQKYPLTGFLTDQAFAVGDAGENFEPFRAGYLQATTGNTEVSKTGAQVANIAETVTNSATRALGTAALAPGKLLNLATYAISSAGATYDDMLEAGNTKGKAAAMAAWNAVTEGVLESYTDKVLLAGGKGVKSVLNGIIGKGKMNWLIRAGAAALNNKYGVLALRFVTAGASEGMEEYLQYFAGKLGERIILGSSDPVSQKEALQSAAMGMVCGTVFAGMGLAGDTIASTAARSHAEKIATDIVENNKMPTVDKTIQLAEEVAEATAELPMTSEELDAAEKEGLILPETVKATYKQAADALNTSESDLQNARTALQEAQANLPFGYPQRVEAVKRYTDAVKARNKAGADVSKAYGKLRQTVDATATEIDTEMLARAQAYEEQENQLAQYRFARNMENDPEGMMEVLAQQEAALTAERERLQAELDAVPAGNARGRELFAEIQQLGTAIDGIKQMISDATAAIAPTTAKQPTSEAGNTNPQSEVTASVQPDIEAQAQQHVAELRQRGATTKQILESVQYAYNDPDADANDIAFADAVKAIISAKNNVNPNLAQQIIADNASRASEKTVTDLLNKARQTGADEDGIALAKEILVNTGAVDTSADSIKAALRGMNIAPTAEERANIAATYGSYDAYRRAVAGVVPLGGVGKQGSVSIDQAIGALQQDFPGQVTGDDRVGWLYQFAQNNPKGKVNYDGDLEADAAELWSEIKQGNAVFFNSSETASFDVPDFNVGETKVNKAVAKEWVNQTVKAGTTADQIREYASKRRYTELSAKGRQFWNNVMEATAKPGQQDFRMSDDETLTHDTIHLFQGNSPYTQGNGIMMQHERSTARARRKMSAIKNDIQRIIGFTYNDEYYSGAARRRGATAYFEPAHNFVSSSDTNNMTAFLHEGGHALNMEQLSPDEVQVFLQEMPATFISQYDLLARPAEAGAEMFRAWMLNPTSMEQKYPNTFAALRRQLGQRRYNSLKEQGNAVRRVMGASTAEKVDSVLHESTKKQKREFGQTFRNEVQSTLDSGYGLKKLDRAAGRRGIALASGGADARASQARTASQAVKALFFDGMYDRQGNRIACSLRECVKGLRGKQKMMDFNAYLEIKQALDRHAANNRDWVFSNDVCTVVEAQAFAERIEREQADIVESANNVWKWLKLYRDTQLSTSISQDVKDQWEKLNPHYIPQTRNFTLDIRNAVHGGGVGGQGTGVNGRRVGSTRDIVSPIDAIANMVARTKSAALQHEVLKTLQEYYDNDSNGVIGQFIHQIDPQRVPHVVPADVIRRAATNTLEQSGLQADALQQIDDLLNANLEDGVTFETRTPNGRVGNAIAITENGVTRYFEIHDQDLLNALTNTPAPQLGAILGGSKKVTGFINSLLTAKNPAFALGNAVRDAQEAYFTGSEQNPVKFVWDYMGALVDVVCNRDVARQYKAMGGSGGLSSVYADGKSVDDLKRAMFGAAGDNRKAAKFAFDKLGDAIETFNGAIETVPRLAEYKRQLRRGASYADAIKAAKNCTTDFSTSGSATASDKALWRFFNASMQSTYKAANMIIDAKTPGNRARATKQLVAMVTLGVAGRALAEILLQINDDDDTYAAMPEYTKDSYWIIPTGKKGKYVKLPLPNGALMTTVNSLGRRIGLAAMGIDDGGEVGDILGDQAAGFLKDVAKGISPFGEFNVGNPLGSNFVFNPLIQVRENTSWTGAPIVPASMDGLSPELQYNEQTSDVAKVIGKVFRMSPMKVDYLISQNSGVIGEVNEALTAAKNDGVGAGIKEFFLSRFMVDTAYSQQVTSAFYDEKEKLQQLAKDVDETIARGEQPYSPILKDLNPKQAQQAAAEAKELKKKMDALAKNLTEVGRQATQAANNGNEEKARDLRFKQQQMVAEATLDAANFFDKWNHIND